MKAPDDYNPEVARAAEWVRGFFALNVVSSRPGRQAKLIEDQEDYGVYLEGVMTALGLHNTDAMHLQTDTYQDAMQDGDAKVLRIFAEAAEDVRRARDEGITTKAKHVASLITAKLELESSLGFLPTRATVRKRACELFRFKFDMEPYSPDDSKSWREAFADAGLAYLEPGNHG